MDLDQEIEMTGKKVLVYLPAGITTTPAWLFQKFTTSSLAKHGIRKVSPGLRTFSPDGQERLTQVEYVIQLSSNDTVRRISKDTPITYLGFKKWE